MVQHQQQQSQEKGIVPYVPFGGKRVDLGGEAVTPAPEHPLLQYATGLPAQRPKMDAQGFALYDENGEPEVENLFYAGFFTEHGKDKDLDKAMSDARAPLISIIHGSGEVVQHWGIAKPVVYLIANGVPTNSGTGGKLGMVYLWRQKQNNPSTRESVLYAQLVLKALLPFGFSKPFIFTVKSTQTTDALTAFSKQYKVLQRVHQELQRYNADMDLSLGPDSLPLGPARKPEVRGSGATAKNIVPLISLIPDELPLTYLQRHEVPLEYVEVLRPLTQASIEWAMSLSARIESGAEPHEAWQGASGVGGEAAL